MIGQRLLQDFATDALSGPVYERMASAGVLKPLSAQETRAFIEHELGAPGWGGCPSFDADVFDLVHRVSGGVPAEIATLCNQLLLQCYVEQDPRITAAKVQAHTGPVSHKEPTNIDKAVRAAQPLERPATDDRQATDPGPEHEIPRRAPDPRPRRDVPRQAAAREPLVEVPTPSAPEPGTKAVFTARSPRKPGRTARRGSW